MSGRMGFLEGRPRSGRIRQVYRDKLSPVGISLAERRNLLQLVTGANFHGNLDKSQHFRRNLGLRLLCVLIDETRGLREVRSNHTFVAHALKD